jgi:type III pantothenate kinase
MDHHQRHWIALVIGNSRLHWAWFTGEHLQSTWNTRHLSTNDGLGDGFKDYLNNHLSNDLSDSFSQNSFSQNVSNRQLTALQELLQETPFQALRPRSASDTPASELPDPSQCLHPEYLHPKLDLGRSRIPLWVASVVPSQTALWQAYPETHLLTLADIPIQKMYSTFGIDRALAGWGAAQQYGLPVLVIDAGTALTFTGIDPVGQFAGGAILPGLGLQIRSLTDHTAALPKIDPTFDPTLPRWAQTTSTAIHSGIVYTLVAGLEAFMTDWMQIYPQSTVVITGGDGQVLFQYLQQSQQSQQTISNHGTQQRFSERGTAVKFDANLVFWGMKAIVQSKKFTEFET